MAERRVDSSALDLTLTVSRIKLQIGNGGIRGDRPPRTPASRKDPVTNSLPPERDLDASEAPTEVPDSSRPLLRRDLRRSVSADSQSHRPANTVRAAAAPETTPETDPAAASAADPEPASSATPTSPTPETDQAAPDAAPPRAQAQAQAQAPHTPRTWDPRLRPRHMAPKSTPKTAPTSRGEARRQKRQWAKTKALGATLAIGVMITGAALPALNPAGGPAAAASSSVSTLADGTAQSYTAKSEIRAVIDPRGNFSATTPEEIKETRSRAAAAAVAAGMPLSSAMDIPLAGRIVMPMADGTYSFTDGFGASRPGRSHLGQDFAAPVGTPINAAMKGCVSRSTESYQGYGVTIQIESIVDGQAVSTVYSHMTYGSRAVEVGDCVDEGQYIGDVGSTGYVFGSCLHFEVHINTAPVDPLPWLKKNVS